MHIEEESHDLEICFVLTSSKHVRVLVNSDFFEIYISTGQRWTIRNSMRTLTQTKSTIKKRTSYKYKEKTGEHTAEELETSHNEQESNVLS